MSIRTDLHIEHQSKSNTAIILEHSTLVASARTLIILPTALTRPSNVTLENLNIVILFSLQTKKFTLLAL
ncbi:hypothetical protein E4T56_gene2926 [Termitomyces sp. T112]|nr:hypothetical protein E4T56_gene2926 [Termitomyces sp. T112]